MHTTTYNNSFKGELIGRSANLNNIGHHRNINVSKSFKPVDSQEREVEYLRKMA